MKNQEMTTAPALFGGDKVCKNCGQKKSILSSYTCPGTSKPHVWVKA